MSTENIEILLNCSLINNDGSSITCQVKIQSTLSGWQNTINDMVNNWIIPIFYQSANEVAYTTEKQIEDSIAKIENNDKKYTLPYLAKEVGKIYLTKVDIFKVENDRIYFYMATSKYSDFSTASTDIIEMFRSKIGEKGNCQAVVTWQLSEKKNSKGNNYKDVVSVEIL